ncbi:hypothetical protein SDC9_41678 [bioreactor metagenome]|uniref:Uncharacterized protein n=1 Tax=bioreactor metagenome TaxID=1076179 RepID=A0A644VW57_9ZZZZ
MGRQGVHTELHKGGGRDGGGDDVAGRRGKPHAQDDADDHGEEGGDEDAASREGDDVVAQDEPQAGEVGDADDVAHHGAGDAHAHALPGARFHCLEEGLPGKPRFLRDEAHAHRGDNAVESRIKRCPADEQEVHDDDDGNEQVSPLPHDLHDGNDLFPGDGLHAHLDGLDVDDGVLGKVVEHRRDGRSQHDLGIVDPEKLGHDEGRRAHDGGHDHASRSRHGDDSRCEDGLEAGAGHEGNGEGSGGRHVAHGASVDHPHEAAGHDGYLGLAADGPSRQ